MVELSLDYILTILVLTFWFVFPIAMFFVMFYAENHNDEFIPMKKTVPQRPRQHSGRPRMA
ncbi:MAG: hypothetical protein V4598_04250 [Bdellovibrionota bacterium]